MKWKNAKPSGKDKISKKPAPFIKKKAEKYTTTKPDKPARPKN